jgi:hypothetical protein
MIGKDRPISPSFLRTIYLKGSQGAPQDRWAGFRSIGACSSAFQIAHSYRSCSLPNRYYLPHFFSMMRLSAVFLKLLPAGISAPPAIRVAICVQEPSGFFLKASQDTSAKPAGYELIV